MLVLVPDLSGSGLILTILASKDCPWWPLTCKL